jgi:hypothetical protein
MPDSNRGALALRGRPRTEPALTAAAQTVTPQQWRDNQMFGTKPWQYEAWQFRRSLGEFNQVIDWESRAMSRIRLGAAEIVPGADEPEMLTEGPASELMAAFCGGPPGHSAFLKSITPHLEIPGEGWLIAERNDPSEPLAAADWGVYSTECVQSVGGYFRVRVGEAMWRDLSPESLPLRIYEPDPQYPWLATSNAEAAVPIMRRIFLIDSRIVAMMVSRLVMNGLMLIPAEGTIQVPEQYLDAPDPFVAFLIDIASKNIANPGNASAGIPIPVKFTADLIDKWKILKADDPLDEWLLKEREDELGRLGDTLGVARERVSGGTGQLNHWNSWQVSEEEVRINFASKAEVICGAITKGFLRPALRNLGLGVLGPRGGLIIAWYDTSELVARPDLTGPAKDAYDRLEISGTAYRRELGFSESDAPTPDELETMAWKKVLALPDLATAAIGQLSGKTPPAVEGLAPAASGAPGPGPGPDAGVDTPTAGGPPATQAVPPPSPAAAPPLALAAAAALTVRPARYAGHNGHRVIAKR